MDLDALPILSALGHPTRWRVFELLLERGGNGMISSEIADAIGIHRSLMSSHLQVMRAAGLVTAAKSGKETTYQVTLAAARKVAEDMMKAIDKAKS